MSQEDAKYTTTFGENIMPSMSFDVKITYMDDREEIVPKVYEVMIRDGLLLCINREPRYVIENYPLCNIRKYLVCDA